MKYRKKPLVVDAWKFEGWRQTQWPDWLLDAVEGGRVSFREDGAYIATLEGTMRADAEDWLIRGVKGEIYPCKPHIFDETYSAVADESEPEVSAMVQRAMTHFYRVLSNKTDEKLKRYQAALSTLTEAAIPIDMWLGHLRQDLSNDERKAFADAVCAALSLVQPGDTTSEPTPGPASPGDSGSSSRTESEDP